MLPLHWRFELRPAALVRLHINNQTVRGLWWLQVALVNLLGLLVFGAGGDLSFQEVGAWVRIRQSFEPFTPVLHDVGHVGKLVVILCPDLA